MHLGVMRKLGFVVISFAVTGPFVPADQVGANLIETSKSTIDELVASGRCLDAMTVIFDALRSIPPNSTEMAYPALGEIQRALFVNEYLMSSSERTTLYERTLNGSNNDMDRFLAVLIWYTDDDGMDQGDTNQRAADLLELTNSLNRNVQLGALFLMSDPYYFKETALAKRARERILQLYPDEYLAREAQRLGLYYYTKRGGAEALRQVFERTDNSGHLYPNSTWLQSDIIGSQIYSELKGVPSSELDQACVRVLHRVLNEPLSWETELVALNILAGFAETSFASTVSEITADVLDRNGDPRSAFRARVIHMAAARYLGDTTSLIEDTSRLLQTNPIPFVPDRMNYEELRNSVEQAVDYLVRAHKYEEAIAFLETLANRFSGTMLHVELTAKRSDTITSMQASQQAETVE